jgi:hypothetical protein
MITRMTAADIAAAEAVWRTISPAEQEVLRRTRGRGYGLIFFADRYGPVPAASKDDADALAVCVQKGLLELDHTTGGALAYSPATPEIGAILESWLWPGHYSPPEVGERVCRPFIRINGP